MKISVLIPVYNVENYISRCLDSILSQSFQDFEIVIVDDCSPDNSMYIVNKYASNDARIRVFKNDINHGLMWTRRVAYKHALGDYIVFVDSDDYLPKYALERMVEKIEIGSYDLVIGNYEYITESEKRSLRKCDFNYGLDRIGIFHSLLLGEVPHNLFAKIYSRKIFEKNTFYTVDHFVNGEDALLFYQIIDKNISVGLMCDSVYFYVQNRKSASSVQYSIEQIDQIIHSLQFQYKLLSKYPCLDKYFTRKVIHTLLAFKLKRYKNRDLFPILTKYHLMEFCSFYKIRTSYSLFNASLIWFVINFVSVRFLNRN